MRVATGLAAAVLAICGCATAASTQAPVPPPHATRAASALVVRSAAHPAAASAARKPSTQLVAVRATSYRATQAQLTALVIAVALAVIKAAANLCLT